MSSWMWKAKQFVRKLIPISIVAVVLYGGYTFYKKGVFRHGVGPALTTMLHKLPYFGSRFRHYGNEAPSSSYTYAPPTHHVRHARAVRRHRRRHHRRH